ncbi:hypothetical protein JTB14_003418 [Gonioctena quinquepunctata]|nr:hypothetical protein JTB14_003418 [Gonioctena quinquepunctata]
MTTKLFVSILALYLCIAEVIAQDFKPVGHPGMQGGHPGMQGGQYSPSQQKYGDVEALRQPLQHHELVDTPEDYDPIDIGPIKETPSK